MKRLELGHACRRASMDQFDQGNSGHQYSEHYRNLARLAVKAVTAAMLISIWFAPQLIERASARAARSLRSAGGPLASIGRPCWSNPSASRPTGRWRFADPHRVAPGRPACSRRWAPLTMARSERGRLTDRMRCKMDKSWAVLLAGDNGSPELCQHTAFACVA